VQAVQSALDAAGVQLRVVSGGEVDVLWAQNASDEDLRAASYGARGTDLLVETPYGELPPIFEDLLFKIRVRGFRVLLAHPERNRSFQQDPARLLRLVDGDVLVQVTAASVVGGGRAGKLALRLIADGHAHVIAGDLHRAGGSRASMREAVAAVDRSRGEWMVNDVPAAILEGRPLPPAPLAEAPARRGWFRRG
jgi:protein-tyrosine phosphatase